jgi:hypothetical protein
MNLEVEQALVRAFILPERRSRWLELLASRKGRGRLMKALAHEVPLDPRFAHLLPSGQQSSMKIETILLSKGAPSTCYVMSEWSELDGREMPLREALNDVVGHGMGTFLSCLPGRLGYFEFEDPRQRYILER